MKSVALKLFCAFNLQIKEEEANQLLPIKAQGLLSYLIINKKAAYLRGFLTTLLWPESNKKSGQTSLRQTIWKLRQVLPESALIINRKTIQFNPKQACSLDISDFNDLFLLAKKQITVSSGQISPSTAKRLEAAFTLYQGRFLGNFEIESSDMFERWQFATAESLLRDALWVGEQLVTYYQDANQTDKEIRSLRRLLELDSWNERLYQQLMRALAKSQQRSEALHLYEQLESTLAVELEIEPEPATKLLYNQILQASLGFPAHVSNPAPKHQTKRHVLTPPLYPLIGRIEMQDQLRAEILSVDTRLLTLVGPGGIGKTHLSQAVSSSIQSKFTHGAVFVPLEGVAVGKSKEEDAQAWYQQTLLSIINALNIPMLSVQESEQALVRYLQDKALLLVLDNFETVMMAQKIVGTLLEASLQLKIIVTSREWLNLQIGKVIIVQGLQTPTDETEDVAQMESVQLFIHEAQRANSFFQLTEENRADVVQLCNQVGGWPLALKMVASWTPHLRADEIVAELSEEHDLLTDANQGFPERHLSMDRVLTSSWKLLTVAEQWQLARLSIFKGMFSQKAARKICRTSLPLLHKFLQKSWIQQLGTGLYILHPLQRQFLAKKWQELSAPIANQNAELETAHVSYYLSLVQKQTAKLQGEHPLASVSKLISVLDEITQAWHWGVKYQLWDSLEQTLPALDIYITRRGFPAVWLLIYKKTIDSLPVVGHAHSLQIRLLISTARIYIQIWNWQKGVRAAMEAKALLDIDRSQYPLNYLADCLQAVGGIYSLTDRHAKALKNLREAKSIYHQTGNAYDEAQAMRYIGTTLMHHSDYTAAQKTYLETYRIQQAIKDSYGSMISLSELAFTYFYAHDFSLAMQYFSEAQIATKDLGFPLLQSRILYSMGLIAWLSDDYEEAQDLFTEALAGSKSSGNYSWEIICWWALGGAAVDAGTYQEANHYLQSGLKRVHEAKQEVGEGILLGELGRLAFAQGKVEEALDYQLSSLAVAIKQNDLSGVCDRMFEIAFCYLKLVEVDSGVSLLQYALHHAVPGLGRFRAIKSISNLPDEQQEMMKRPLPEFSIEHEPTVVAQQVLQKHRYHNMSIL